MTDANTLNTRECGLTDGSVEGDWRLPNLREMQSLVDYGQSSPALPSGHPFTGVHFIDYWTSTTNADDTLDFWIVSLFDGFVYNGEMGSPLYVWPVRGGQDA